MQEIASGVERQLLVWAESFVKKTGDGCCTAMPAQTKTSESPTQGFLRISKLRNKQRITIDFLGRNECGEMTTWKEARDGCLRS